MLCQGVETPPLVIFSPHRLSVQLTVISLNEVSGLRARMINEKIA